MRVFLIALAILYWVCANMAKSVSTGFERDVASQGAETQHDSAIAALDAVEPPLYAAPPVRSGACAAEANAAGADGSFWACVEAADGAPR